MPPVKQVKKKEARFLTLYSEVCYTFSLIYSEVSIIVIHFEFLSTGYIFTNRKVCGHYAMVYLPLFCV